MIERMVGAYARLVTPRPSGLPNLPVLFAMPALFVMAAVALIVLGVSGTSQGVFWDTFGTGTDPDLLAGEPRPIRSDEWLVQSSWVVSQVQQGFPVVNQTFPGGMDATIQNDLPTWDWSTAFRPHVSGFLVLPLDNAMAARWWIPALAVVLSVYFFAVTVLPKNPIAAAALAIGVLLSPILQWWFLPTTLWPVAFAFSAMTAVLWAFWCRRRWPSWLLAAATAYIAVAMAMSIYVPFMIPAVLVVVLFTLGAAVFEVTSRKRAVGRVCADLVPLASAAVAAAGVAGVWVATRVETVRAVTSTVYPGERLQETGAVNTIDTVAAIFGGPFLRSLLFDVTDGLGANQSEASTPLLAAVFLLLPMIWAAFARGTKKAGTDYILLATVASVLIVFAYLLVPDWDLVAHALVLDRTTTRRIRLAFLILGVVGVVLLVRRLRTIEQRTPWLLVALSVGGVVAASLAVATILDSAGSSVTAASKSWILSTILLAAAVACAARAAPFFAAVSMLLATSAVAWGVNPLYLGVFDLRTTDIGVTVAELERAEPRAVWIGIGSHVPTAVLVESGVSAFNGVQTYPPDEMWAMIDPVGRYEDEWNRLANVKWIPGSGEPTVENPELDQIVVTFDSCSDFAGQNVRFVLADVVLDQACLTLIESVSEGPSILRVYRVVD